MKSQIFYRKEIEDLELTSSRGKQQFKELNYQYDIEIKQMSRDFKSYHESKVNGFS